jgi:XTP/dITP diphosphohydrolase
MVRLVFATNNSGKLHEVRVLAKQYDVEILLPADLGIKIVVEENGKNYKENALLKMQAVLDSITDKVLWVAGDDSGVAIDALGGEPGIHTRRWAGYEMTDQEIIDYTINSLTDVPGPKRTAHFDSTVAVGRLGSKPKLFRGRVDGYILKKPNNKIPLQDGLPFKSLFYTKQRRYLGHNLNVANHRQKAFIQIFEFIGAPKKTIS